MHPFRPQKEGCANPVWSLHPLGKTPSPAQEMIRLLQPN